MDMYTPSHTAAPPTSFLDATMTADSSFMVGNSSAQNTSIPPVPPNTLAQGGGSAPAPNGLHSRSCVTCRRRKVKCDKKFPCSNCSKAGGECVFPAPGRAPRRPRLGAPGGRVVSEREAELLKRLRRLEGVVEELSGQVDIAEARHSPLSDNSSPAGLGAAKENDNVGGMGEKGGSVRVVGMDEGTGKGKGRGRGEWITKTFRIGGGPPKTAYSVDDLQVGVGRLRLEEGKSQYLASPFWSRITDEMDEIKEMLEDQEFDSGSDTPVGPTESMTVPNHQSFIMGYSSSDVELKSLHPLPSQIPFYWQTFLENVQPLVKIIHTPTMNKTIKEVANNLSNLKKSTEALMFSIYFAAITSMNGVEVQTNFGVDKEVLLRQYRFATEQALAKASLLNTDEIVTVQAFVMFLVCVRRHDDTRFVWSLTGLALRIAQSLGLHRDGTKFGLTPFDTEMRRRLWWQVCILDTRAAEDYGSDPSILDFSYDTQFPTSLNDEDLDPAATEPPVPREGVSEMTFPLIRYEICQLTRKVTYIPPGSNSKGALSAATLEEKERMVRECAEHLEHTYLRHCEDAGPLYWVAATVGRLIIAKMSLIVYHPLTQPGRPNSLSQDIKDRLFMASIEIIEYSRVLESEASTKQWGWLFHTYIQWHAIAYILGELCTRPNSVIVERAWRAVDLVFAEWKGAVSSSKSGMLWQPMRKLLANANRKREENTRLYGANPTESAGWGLGMPKEYVKPPPTAYGKSSDNAIARDRLLPLVTDTINNPDSPTNSNIPSPENMQMETPEMRNQALPERSGPGINSMFQMPDSNFPTSHAEQSHVHQQPVHGYDMGPHTVGVGSVLSPGQGQAQMMQQQPQNQESWPMDDNAMSNLDMAALEGEVNWEGWDALVRDYQMQADNSQEGGTTGRGPTLGGMGQWW